jgi:hypothetical protein
VEEAIGLLAGSGALDEAREKGRGLLSAGRSKIEGLLEDSEARALMLGLVDTFARSMT